MAYKGKFEELEQLYEAHTCCIVDTLAYDVDLITDAQLEAWVKDIYTTGKGSMHMPTVHKVAHHYWDAVKAGYGAEVSSVDLASPDNIMLTRLLNSCYTFSAAKNQTHLQQLTALINNNGKVREWPDYYAEASKLNLKLNKTWLKTEYDLALAGSTMASKWVHYQSEPNTMIKYSTVGDARVRDSHRLLDGITLPIGHEFWDRAYPPNEFKCRCDAFKIPYTTPATPDGKLPGTGNDVIPPMFQVNLAKASLVFPKSHPYYAAGKAIETKAKAATKAAAKAIESKVVKADAGGGFTPTNLQEIIDVNGDDIDTSIFSYLKQYVPLDTSINDGAFYSPTRKNVNIWPTSPRSLKADKYLSRVLYHEYGHAIDWQYNLRGNKLVTELMNKHRKILRANTSAGYRAIDKKIDELQWFCYKKKLHNYGEYLGALSDTIMSLNSMYGDGHKKSYFKRPYMQEAEFLAHMFENVFGGNPVFKKLMPELYDDTLALWEQLKKEVILK